MIRIGMKNLSVENFSRWYLGGSKDESIPRTRKVPVSGYISIDGKIGTI